MQSTSQINEKPPLKSAPLNNGISTEKLSILNPKNKIWPADAKPSQLQSLPDCSKEVVAENSITKCDDNGTNDLSWFRTWPERCDKQKNDTNIENNAPKTNNTHTQIIQQQFTLNEALQNISLAYSPITKQLHLIENKATNLSNGHVHKSELNNLKEPLHINNDICNFSNVEQSQVPFNDDNNFCNRKKSLTHFFTKTVFSWTSMPVTSTSINSWKLFSKSNGVSPINSDLVASSSALIQHKRPSYLPAKTAKEEQKHNEEYESIIADAKRKEVQNQLTKQKLQKVLLRQEEQQANATKHFTQKVLPHWEAMKSHRKTQEMWWQGLPSSVRGKVWRLAIGNELNISREMHESCLTRARTKLGELYCKSDIDQENSMNVIQLDISRTFPHLCIFQEGGPYSEILHLLLAAYVCYRPEVGYVQGMSYVAAILILNMEQEHAFVCFSNLLNKPLHLSAFTLNQQQMQAYYKAYNQVFSYNLPKLYGHFEAAGLTPDLYLLDWIYTIYAKAMPLDVACRVWDVFLRDGYEFIFRTALGILHLNQEILINMDFLHGAQFLTRLPDDLSSDRLFKSIKLVTTSIGKQCFSQIVQKYTDAVS